MSLYYLIFGRKNRKGLDTKMICLYIPKIVDAGWSSLVARRAHNPKVRGSNPLPATI